MSVHVRRNRCSRSPKSVFTFAEIPTGTRAPGQPRPPPLRVSRTGRPTPGTASSSRPMAARYPDRRRRRGRQLHRQLPEPVIGHARRALHPRCTEARTTRVRRRRSPDGDQAAVAFRADCLIRGSGRPISLRLLSHGTRFPLQSPGVSGIGQGTAVLRQLNTAGRVVILVRCACGNGTVAPSQARTLHLSASGPGGLLESRPELHTDLVMTTRGCSWKPLATGRLSQGGGVRSEPHAAGMDPGRSRPCGRSRRLPRTRGDEPRAPPSEILNRSRIY